MVQEKIGGKLYYFGTWDDPEGALREYLKIKDELQAGNVKFPMDSGRLFGYGDLLKLDGLIKPEMSG